MVLALPAPSLRNDTSLVLPRSEHPFENLRDIQAAAVNTGETTQQHLASEEPRVTGVGGPLDPNGIRTTAHHVSLLRRPDSGPSDLRYSHLQAIISIVLAEDIAAVVKTVIKSDAMPDLFWFLHVSVNTLGLVACGDVLRRIIDETFLREYSESLHMTFWSHSGSLE